MTIDNHHEKEVGDLTLQECPYCNLPGLVTTMKVSASGFEVTGKCVTCGYSYDSEYDPTDVADDLQGEYSRQLEAAAAD
jgi:hypothetical protein